MTMRVVVPLTDPLARNVNDRLKDAFHLPRDLPTGIEACNFRRIVRALLASALLIVTGFSPVHAETPADRVNAILSLDGDPDYGAYLGGECVACHQSSGNSDGIPSIIGLPQDYFIQALLEYKLGVRNNQVMRNRVQTLGDEEIAALAAHFSAMEPK